jgi:hypothetical protein
MKKVKAPGAKSNVVSCKPFPQAVPSKGDSTKIGGVGNTPENATTNYKKGK